MWHVSSAAVQGLAHIDEDTPCQDKTYSLVRNGVTAIALADGAGSARLSHLGAEIASRSVCELLCSDFSAILNSTDPYALRQSILEHLLEELRASASENDCTLDDLSSTLLAAASDGENVMTLHVGDGMIACCKDGKIFASSMPDNGEFKNETVFITSEDAVYRMRLAKSRAAGISMFALMSDGTSEVFWNSKEGKFAGLLEEIRQRGIMYPDERNNADLAGLFSEIVRHRTRDDCSLIMMCRPDEYFRGYRDLDDEDKRIFLGLKSDDGRENREKVLGIIAGEEQVSRRVLFRRAEELGLKRRQVSGILRELDRKGLIERLGVLRRKYRLTFCW